MSARTLSAERFVLAEGPQVNPYDGTVSWVDIETGRICIGRISDDHPDHGRSLGDISGTGIRLDMIRTVQLSGRVGCAFPLAGARFLAAIDRRIAIIDEDDHATVSRELLDDGRRFNDGIIDPAGRLIVGSLSLEGAPDGNVLLRLEHDGSITTLDDDLRLANGMGFSPDSRTLYYVDSLAHVVFARDYNSQSGTVGPRRIVVEVNDAEPDGLAVDADGDLWVALWRGHGIRRFSADGTVAGQVTIGPPQVTSLCFLPEPLGMLVTTASLGMTDDDLVTHPDAGALFTVASNILGRPMFRWKECPLPVA